MSTTLIPVVVFIPDSTALTLFPGLHKQGKSAEQMRVLTKMYLSALKRHGSQGWRALPSSGGTEKLSTGDICANHIDRPAGLSWRPTLWLCYVQEGSQSSITSSHPFLLLPMLWGYCCAPGSSIRVSWSPSACYMLSWGLLIFNTVMATLCVSSQSLFFGTSAWCFKGKWNPQTFQKLGWRPLPLLLACSHHQRLYLQLRHWASRKPTWLCSLFSASLSQHPMHVFFTVLLYNYPLVAPIPQTGTGALFILSTQTQ